MRSVKTLDPLRAQQSACRRPTAALAGLSAVAVLLAGCGGPAPASKTASTTAPAVETVTVGADASSASVRAAGMVAYQREAGLSFRTPGLIRQIMVDEGDRVRRGQVLARLDLTDLDASVAEAATAVRNAEAQLGRDKALLERGFIAQARVDASELSLARARSALAAISSNRNQAVISAPADGVVLRRLAEPNQNAAAGAPILVVGSAGAGLVVRAGFSADAVSRIKLGDRGQARLVDGRFRTVRVIRIAADADPVTNAFDVEAALEEVDGLRSGQVAELLIATASQVSTKLRLPSTALLDARADQGVVYVVGPNNAVQRRAVRTAGVEGDDVVIAEGLKAGEQVVVAGAAFIRDGQTVTPQARTGTP